MTLAKSASISCSTLWTKRTCGWWKPLSAQLKKRKKRRKRKERRGLRFFVGFPGVRVSGKQCNPGRIAKSLLVGSAPKPLKTRACALWLCRIPASFDLLASPEKQKRKAPVPVKLLRTASDTGALLSFWVLFPSEIFLFWQVVPFQNIKIILDVIQCCKLRFQSFESGIISFFLRFKRLVFGG